MTLPMPHVQGVAHRYEVVDGVRLHYAEAGEGEPLLLVHGWPQHWWSWRELIPGLAEHYRVLAPDVRGMGWSDAPRSGYERDRLVADLLGLMDRLGLERVRLAGHDWGLLLGYQACLERPERFERFVPMAGVHPWSWDGAPPGLFARAWHIYVLAGPAGRLCTSRLGLPDHALRAWRRRGRFTSEEVQIYTSPLRLPLRANATAERYRKLVTRDLAWFMLHHRELRLRVPTLHLNGERDPLTQGVPGSWRGRATDMRLEHVPGAGHFVAEERPGWVLERMLDFLS